MHFGLIPKADKDSDKKDTVENQCQKHSDPQTSQDGSKKGNYKNEEAWGKFRISIRMRVRVTLIFTKVTDRSR